jgi:hypothetical protein
MLETYKALILALAMLSAQHPLPAHQLARRPVAPAGGGSGARNPWVVQRVLGIQAVGHLCQTHPSDHFVASVRGYLETILGQGPAGGSLFGRIFDKPNPRAFEGSDTTPFVQVSGTFALPFRLSSRLVTVHGVLACDAAVYRQGLPGWQASIRPDRIRSF